MLLRQGCLLIYTSVDNTWISLISMLHNCFTESFCLFFILYLVLMCTVPKAEWLHWEHDEALRFSHPDAHSGNSLVLAATQLSTLGQ